MEQLILPRQMERHSLNLYESVYFNKETLKTMFINNMKKLLNQEGIIHTLPLLVIIAVVGVISFLLISSTAPFGQGLFKNINPKPLSHAATPVGIWTNVTPIN